ncbi:phosphoglycolate phosphatase-like HAD superfamily hydrolase [Neorhizobium galegae]|uniref:HAD family hydrolase n=1 Tax=Neorhizobium galegae TaxID=399 RepID=UPI001AE5B727|nr:HAD family hydrolase [Neorhizobium galegae]MBP2560092.1 phosphoglycolate phosphatase-like HAD superfamily hydrolase [Neorhizobium galegae]
MSAFLGFDADGVLTDSRRSAFGAASKILALLGAPEELSEQGDFDRLFGAEALDKLVGHHRADALRGTHRLAMLHASASLPLFEATLAVIGRQPLPRIVITAAYADGVRTALGRHARLFDSITGFETGRKAELMAAMASRMRVYVTDSLSDLRICQRLNIPTIAVTGGYDKAEDLIAAGADLIATTPGELEIALARFHPQQLTHIKENDHDFS